MPIDLHAGGDDEFGAAVAQLEAGLDQQATARPELSLESEPPPRRLAPHAVAFAATIEVAGHEIGGGRFVLLYDPAGQDGWEGPFRVIAYVRAELEPEIATDPLVGQVGWSWLTEALDARSARYAAPSGTVTTVVTEGFGAKGDEPTATEFEMRASWSPVRTALAAAGAGRMSVPVGAASESCAFDRHIAAWIDTLCQACGLPPVEPGVAQLRPPKRRARRGHER